MDAMFAKAFMGKGVFREGIWEFLLLLRRLVRKEFRTDSRMGEMLLCSRLYRVSEASCRIMV